MEFKVQGACPVGIRPHSEWQSDKAWRNVLGQKSCHVLGEVEVGSRACWGMEEVSDNELRGMTKAGDHQGASSEKGTVTDCSHSEKWRGVA